MEWSRFACRRWGIIVAMKAWLFGSCADEERELRFWFDQLPDLKKKLAGRGLYLLRAPLARERPLSCML